MCYGRSILALILARKFVGRHKLFLIGISKPVRIVIVAAYCYLLFLLQFYDGKIHS